MSKRSERDEVNRFKGRKRFMMVVLYGIVLLPWIIPAAYRALQSNANSPLDWVGDDFAPRLHYDQFCRDFGTADSVIISWPECEIGNARIDAFVAALRGAPAFRDRGKPLFHQVTSGREIVAAMNRPPLAIPVDEAIARLRGTIVGADGRATYVLVGFSEEAVRQRSRLVPLIRQAALRHGGAAYESQHLAGPIMDGYEVDRASQATVTRLAPLSSVAVLLLCYLCLDSIIATLVVFGVSLLCQLVTMALVDLSGGTMTALLVVLPPLVQVLAISGGIHFVNYYVDAREVTDRSTALSRAFQIAWLPCVLSAVTTAIGLGSLGVSGLIAVREFATYAAAGVLITVVIGLVSLRGFFQWLPIPRPTAQRSAGAAVAWLQLSNWQRRNWGWVCGVAFVSMIGLGIGVMRLQASVRIETLFRADSRLIQDYAWLEEHVGSLVPVEVVATFHPSSDLGPPQRLQLLRNIERRLRRVPRVDGVISSLSFTPSIQNATFDNRLASERATRQLAVAGALGRTFNFQKAGIDGSQKWRSTAYVSALGQNDYVEIMRELRAALPPQLTVSSAAQSPGHTELQVSGLMPLVHDIQQQLLRDLFSSFLTAFRADCCGHDTGPSWRPRGIGVDDPECISGLDVVWDSGLAWTSAGHRIDYDSQRCDGHRGG